MKDMDQKLQTFLMVIWLFMGFSLLLVVALTPRLDLSKLGITMVVLLYVVATSFLGGFFTYLQYKE